MTHKKLSSLQLDPLHKIVLIGIRFQSDLVDRLKIELRTLTKTRQELQASFESANKACARHRKDGDQLKIAAQEASAEAEVLQDDIDHETVEEGYLESLRAELQNAVEHKESYSQTFQTAIITRDELKAEFAKYKTQLEEIDIRLATVDMKLVEAKKANFEALKNRQTILQRKNAAIDQVVSEQRRSEELKEKRDEHSLLVIEWRKKASRISPRVPIPPAETTESLGKKCEKLGEDIRRHETRYLLQFFPN